MDRKNIILTSATILLVLGTTAGGYLYLKNSEIKNPEAFAQETEKKTEKNGKAEIGELVPFTVNGPGGCKNIEECQNYCQTNPQECISYETSTEELSEENQIFSEQVEQPSQEQANPEDCRSPEGCNKPYCSINSQECADLQSQNIISEQTEEQEQQKSPIKIAPPQTGTSIENTSLLGSIIQAFADFFRY